MFKKFIPAQYLELLWVVSPIVAGVLLTFWIAAQFMAPASPKELVIAAATKGSPYYQTAESYRRVLSENGVNLKIIETTGSIENLALLNEDSPRVNAAFLQGGVANSTVAPNLFSVGRVFYEPLWVFYSQATKFDKIGQLIGKKVLIGPAGSATALLATKLLKASGVTSDTATLINLALPDYIQALESGQADAGFLVLAPEAKTIGKLLGSQSIKLFSFSQSDAYIQRFPFLCKVTLREGVIDLAKDLPQSDTTLLATTAALVVRKDTDGALVNLLTQAIISAHSQPVTNATGEAGIFQRAGVFPLADDQEYPLSPEAARVYKSGKPFLQRYLPFWLATMVDRLTVLLVPIIGVLLPALRFAPVLYSWRIRRRILHWYRALQIVDEKIDVQLERPELLAAINEISRIEMAVNRIPIPVGFANQLYDLKEHIDVVRRRLVTMLNK